MSEARWVPHTSSSARHSSFKKVSKRGSRCVWPDSTNQVKIYVMLLLISMHQHTYHTEGLLPSMDSCKTTHTPITTRNLLPMNRTHRGLLQAEDRCSTHAVWSINCTRSMICGPLTALICTDPVQKALIRPVDLIRPPELGTLSGGPIHCWVRRVSGIARVMRNKRRRGPNMQNNDGVFIIDAHETCISRIASWLMIFTGRN